MPELAALIASFGTSSGAIRAEEGVEQVLRRIVDAALVSIPGARHAGISTVDPGGSVAGRVPTDDLVARVDQLQVEVDEGPCLEAIRTGTTVLVEDLARERARWPRFVPRALDVGLRGTLSLPLITRRGRPDVALNLHAEHPGEVSGTDVAVGRLFAVLAERTLDGAFAVDGLHVALEHRDVIGQAKGMLMLRHGLDAEQAFDWLRDASQAADMKLVDAARWFVADVESSRTGDR